MKRINQLFFYLKPFRWNVVVNMVCNVLSTTFSLLSFAMLIPFLRLIMNQNSNAEMVANPGAFSFSIDNLIAQYNYFLNQIILHHDKISALAIVCVSAAAASFLKNFFR